MKTLKVMSIVGIVIAGLSLICEIAFDNPVDYEAAIGWGFIATIYLLAVSITLLAKANKYINK